MARQRAVVSAVVAIAALTCVLGQGPNGPNPFAGGNFYVNPAFQVRLRLSALLPAPLAFLTPVRAHSRVLAG